MSLRRIPCLLATVLVATAGCTRSSGAAGAEDPTSQPNPSGGSESVVYEVFADGADARIVRADLDDGSSVTFYGSRQANGLPESVYAAAVVNEAGMTYVEMDESGMPCTFRTPDGNMITIEWQAEESLALIRATTADASLSTETMVDLTAEGSPGLAAVLANRQVLAGNLSATGLSALGALPSQSGQAVLRTAIETCGIAPEMFVLTRIYDADSGELLGEAPGRRVLTLDEYETFIATGERTLEPSANNCATYGAALGLLCPLVGAFPLAPQLLCTALIAVPEGVLFVTTCEAMVTAFQGLCRAIPGGAGLITQQMCEAIWSGVSPRPMLKLVTTARPLGGDEIVLPPVFAEGGSSFFVNNTVTLPPIGFASARLIPMVLEPAFPVATFGYGLSTGVSCFPGWGSVRMTEYHDGVRVNEQVRYVRPDMGLSTALFLNFAPAIGTFVKLRLELYEGLIGAVGPSTPPPFDMQQRSFTPR